MTAAANPVIARPLPSRNEMQRAFLAADPSFDGVFYTGVKTTGIFCRPSCAARKPKPENTEFFATPGEALFAGYRACLRCKPMEAPGAHPEWVQRLIAVVEQSETGRLPAAELRAMHIEPARARRYFQKHFGLSFQAYCRSKRLSRGLDSIRRNGSVDDGVFDSGYESHSGFRESFTRHFGLTPAKATGMDCIRVAWIETPLGPMIAGATDQNLVLLEFTDRRMLERELAELRRRVSPVIAVGDNAILRQLKRELSEYFAGRRRSFTVPVAFAGSEFEQRVWRELITIPCGETRCYEQMAASIGVPQAPRAVGRANGNNRIAIVIPCHRVVRKTGEVGGYGGGAWRKRLLLHLERTGEPITPSVTESSA